MKFTYEITRDDYYEFNKHHFIKTRLMKAAGFVILICAGLYVVLKNEENSLWLNSIPSLAAGTLFALSIFIRLRQTKNIPDENGAILGEKEIEFGETQISCKSRNAQSTYEWTVVKELQENKNAFYLYMDNYVAILLPKRVFSGEAELQSFREQVNSKLAAQKN